VAENDLKDEGSEIRIHSKKERDNSRNSRAQNERQEPNPNSKIGSARLSVRTSLSSFSIFPFKGRFARQPSSQFAHFSPPGKTISPFCLPGRGRKSRKAGDYLGPQEK